MTDSYRRAQHLVSKGYQHNFADGWRVAVLDARTGAVIDGRRRIQENWTVDDFLSVEQPDGSLDDGLERDYARREQRFLNEVRAIAANTVITDKRKAAIDALAAAHLARSQSFAEAHRLAAMEALDEAPDRLARDPRALAAFVKQYGRAPQAGELQAIVAAAARKFAAEPDLFPSGVRRVDAGIREMLGKWTVQLVELADTLPGLVLPDNPVLHGRRSEGRFGFRAGVAIGDADTIIVPIRRRLAALYSGQPVATVRVTTLASLRWINSLLLRSALTEVACHPDDAQEVSRLIKNLDRYPPHLFDTIRIH